MAKLRLAVKKSGALQFLSHLDFARTVRYVIIRAALPVCYSEGFNPHMKLNFASALGVGVSADEEYLDMELQEPVSVEDVIRRMNAASPEGFAVLKGMYIDAKAPKLMAAANYAEYRLQGPMRDGAAQEDVDAALQAFNEVAEVLYERVSPKDKRKVRCINIKHHVAEPATGSVSGQCIMVHIGILQTAEGAVKPSQVWEVLCQKYHLPSEPHRMLACRTGLYHRRNGKNISLFEII